MKCNTVPKVHILILNYNNAEDTIACIESVCRSTYPSFEIVVIDNASTDDSSERIITWLKSRGDVYNSLKADEVENPVPQRHMTFIQNDRNAGFAGGNRVGADYVLAHADEGYIVLLNNDTTVDPDFLQPMIDVYAQREDAGLVGGLIRYADQPGKIWFAGGDMHWYREATHRTEIETEADIAASPFITGCLMMMPLALIRRVGFMDERYFLYVEDSDYSKTVLEHGYRNYVALQSVVYHKVGATTGGPGASPAYYYGTRNRLYYHYRHYPAVDFWLFFIAFCCVKAVRLLMLRGRNAAHGRAKIFQGIRDFFVLIRTESHSNGERNNLHTGTHL